MKRDFTQPFEQSRVIAAHFLVEVSGDRFALVKDVEEDFNNEVHYYMPSAEIDESAEVVGQITRSLFEKGLVLTSFREIVRTNDVSFSFIDDTPGRSESEVCFFVRADITKSLSQDIELMAMPEVHEKIQTGLYLPEAVWRGLLQITHERVLNARYNN